MAISLSLDESATPRHVVLCGACWWEAMAGDLQILRPHRPAADTAVIPAVRLRVVFQEV